MKALLLAAGLGTRLRPLTLTTPKPLLPIGGRPLLARQLDHLRAHGVDAALINTHYLPRAVEDFAASYRKEHSDFSLTTAFEPALLGSAGTLRAHRHFFDPEDDFLIVYADVLTDLDYSKLLAYHREHQGLVTLACYQEEHPEQKGIIEFDESGHITRFVEKPKAGETASNYANAGFYAAKGALLSKLAAFAEEPLDFGFHVFPALLAAGERLVAYPMAGYALDIGTPESYTKAQTLV